MDPRVLWASHHLPLHIFHKFLRVLDISFHEDHLCSFYCPSCNINKSQKLPFAKLSFTSYSPLDVFFYDVWTSPVSSFDGFNYYVIFVDHYTKYIWLYSFRRKSDVHFSFVSFKKLVENYLNTVEIT